MSRETPAKSTDADKLVDCEGQGDLEDLADLANTYLLGPQDLTSDLTDAVQAVLVDHVADLSPQVERSPQDGLEIHELPGWSKTSPFYKNGDLAAFKDPNQIMQSGEMVGRDLAEPVDSSDWDQTQEQFGSQVGGKQTMKNTESPESVLNTRSSHTSGNAEAQRPSGNHPILEGSPALTPADNFLPRDRQDGTSAAPDVEQNAPPASQSGGRMYNLGDRSRTRELAHCNDAAWERRTSFPNTYASFPLPDHQYQPSSYHGSMIGADQYRHADMRDSWGPGPMTAGPIEGDWRARGYAREMGNGLPRMQPEKGAQSLRERFPTGPVRGQFTDELYDAPRGSLDIMSGPGASPLDTLLGDPEMTRLNNAQGDARRGHRRSNSTGFPPQSPLNRISGPVYAVQQSCTPLESRKRRRVDGPFYHQHDLTDHGMHQGRGPHLPQDDLITTLKQQIAMLDQSTKSLLKMTLYRISRNANTSAEGVGEASYQNPRNALLDKVVANFMYNRFSRSSVPRPTNVPPVSSNAANGGVNYFSRAASSPNMTYETGTQGLDMGP